MAVRNLAFPPELQNLKMFGGGQMLPPHIPSKLEVMLVIGPAPVLPNVPMEISLPQALEKNKPLKKRKPN